MNKRLRNSKQLKNDVTGYLFITPFIIGFFLFTLYPFFRSFYLSFTDYDILTPPKWIGFGNYIKMFTADPKILQSLKITFRFAIVQVPLKLAFALLVAVLLSKKTRLTGVYRAIFYIPSLLGGGVAVALTWKKVWQIDGVVNTFLAKLGITGPNWLNDTRTALYILILLGVWQFGSQMLIFLAAIKDVPKSLEEAAEVDGCGPIRRFFTITIPMISPAIFFNLVQGIIGSLQAFSSAFLITEGGPMNSTLYYGLYQYRQAFVYHNMGYASAMAWVLLVIILALTALVFKSSSAWVYYQGES